MIGLQAMAKSPIACVCSIRTRLYETDKVLVLRMSGSAYRRLGHRLFNAFYTTKRMVWHGPSDPAVRSSKRMVARIGGTSGLGMTFQST